MKCLILALCIFSLPLGVRAQAAPPTVDAAAVLVMDRNSKEVLHAVNPDREWPLASITKLAAAMVALQHGKLGTISRVTADDDVGGAKLHVRSGTPLTLHDMLAATLIGSANNTANALVRAIGYTRTQFVKEMNAYAKRVGATHTHFTEPSGIDPANVSTAGDLALIARDAFSNQTIRTLTTSSSYTIRLLNTGKLHRIKNTDKLITQSPIIVMGGKTGLLDESRSNFVVEVRNKAWQRLMVVVLGAPSFHSAFSSAEKLANWAWREKLAER